MQKTKKRDFFDKNPFFIFLDPFAYTTKQRIFVIRIQAFSFLHRNGQ